MTPGQIIGLVTVVIFLIAMFFVLREHEKTSRFITQKDFIDRFVENREQMLAQSGSGMSLNLYIALLFLVPFALFALVYFISKNVLFAIFVGLVGIFVPRLVMLLMKQQKQKKFEENYAKSLEQMSSSLRAGLTIMQAVEDTAQCKFLNKDMRNKYAKLSADLQMGLDVAEAFHKFAEGTESQDAEDVALALDIQNEVGGHEADVVQDIAANIQTRIMTRREVKSIFASTSSMVYVMDFVPLGTMIIFGLMNRTYVEFYFGKVAYTILFFILLLLPVIGSLWNHRILKQVKKGD